MRIKDSAKLLIIIFILITAASCVQKETFPVTTFETGKDMPEEEHERFVEPFSEDDIVVPESLKKKSEKTEAEKPETVTEDTAEEAEPETAEAEPETEEAEADKGGIIRVEKVPPGSNMINAVYGKPYTVRGITYHRLESVEKFTQTGYASWYGKEEHGKKTASGERYNMYAETAAHKALPLGSYVLVTNLENGRRITVKINDRGPHVPGRIIDLSYRGAKELGIVDSGVTKVRIHLLNGEKPAEGEKAVSASAPEGAHIPLRDAHKEGFQDQKIEAAKPHEDPQYDADKAEEAKKSEPDKQAEPDAEAVQNVETATASEGYAVQIGSFSDAENAEKTAASFSSARVQPVDIAGKTFYRVQVTGFDDKLTAEGFANKASEKFPGAFVITD